MSNQSDERFGRLLRGANNICAYLRELGEVDLEPQDIYYIHRTQKYPITKHGRDLIANTSQLARHARKISTVS
jgi:hypothetical protein